VVRSGETDRSSVGGRSSRSHVRRQSRRVR
jgi:hypothetical protein